MDTLIRFYYITVHALDFICNFGSGFLQTVQVGIVICAPFSLICIVDLSAVSSYTFTNVMKIHIFPVKVGSVIL